MVDIEALRGLVERDDNEQVKKYLKELQAIEQGAHLNDPKAIKKLQTYFKAASEDRTILDAMPASLIQLAAEIASGSEIKPPARKESRIDRALHTRERRTLLIVIAALCKYDGIDFSARGSSQRIREMTEDLGAPIDDETIRRIIGEIQEALETRMN